MLLASFIAPFMNPSSFPAPPAGSTENNRRKRQRLSQRERRAIRQMALENASDRFSVGQSRAKRFQTTSEWTTTTERVVGEITSWNQRAGFGFIKTEGYNSDVIVYARDIDIPSEFDTGQKKKRNLKGFKVEFEMKFENQARAVNATMQRDSFYDMDVSAVEDEKNVVEKVWSSTFVDGGRVWEDSAVKLGVSVARDEEDEEDSPKRKSGGVKIKSTRSRRSLAKNVEMDLMEWREEMASPSIRYFKDYDSYEVVEKRRNGHKLKLEREREAWKKSKMGARNRKPSTRRTYASRVAPRAVAPSRSSVKWVSPKKDTHFETFYKMFEQIASTKPQLQNRESVAIIVQKLYQKVIPSEGLQKHIKTSAPSTTQPTTQECPVCFTQFDGSTSGSESEGTDDLKIDGVCPRMSNCGHGVLCLDCLDHYVSLKIRDGEILPWLTCPAEKCRAPIHFTDILENSVCGVSTAQLYKFCLVILQKQLSRSPKFVPCGGKVLDDVTCSYGFFSEKEVTRRCKVCDLIQQVSPKSPEDFLDDGFKALLRTGALRLCPTCSHPAMKDYGMCNVMECVKCGIYWNWNSKLTGSTYSQVKENGRRAGTLWEYGELDYQRNLQQTNPKAFKALLERNGIKYDPNFVRGRS